MISIIRRIINSKFGALIAILFLGMIAAAFVLGDISGNSMGGLMGGGETTAKAGGSSISSKDLQDRVQRAFETARKRNPGMQIGDFLAQGGVDIIYDELVKALTLKEYAKDQDIHISKRLIDAQIAQIPAFQDAAGNFSQDLFRQLLARERMTEGALRDDIARDILEKQMLRPAGLGATVSNSLALPYASLLLEARQGVIAAIPAIAFLDEKNPTDAQLADFYKRNADRFTIPEQRRVRYAIIDADRFAMASRPTDAEIAAYYNSNKAQFAAKEDRSVEQLVLPTEAGAKAIADQVKAGKTLAAAAQGAGLSVATLAAQSRTALTAASSAAVANAAFAARQGELVGPVRGSLGWVLLRVTAISGAPARPLTSAQAEIAATLRVQKEKALLNDFTAKVEDQIANGAALEEVVKDNGLKLETTPLMVADGREVENSTATPSDEVKALLAPVFGMSADDDAQLIAITPDKRYALAAPGDIVPAAPPPLAKVKPAVLAQYKLNQGNEKAKALAEKIRGQVAKGMKLADAIAGAGVKLPAPQIVGGRRADMMRGDQRPPVEVATLFRMKANDVKTVPIGQDRGTFIVQLSAIKRGDAGRDAALLGRVRDELGQATAEEYGQQLERAIEKSLGVKRYPAAVARVEKALGSNNSDGAQ